ncbi:MAG TPA: hypothetical protein PKE27_12565 [Povalibacter sp.]|nr:hypothetical protein [Povalibacter sp.]HMN45407.1 hypothetical protein [Povalibacter sp.]
MATNLSVDPELIEQSLKVSVDKDQGRCRHEGIAGVHRPAASEGAARTCWKARMGRRV